MFKWGSCFNSGSGRQAGESGEAVQAGEAYQWSPITLITPAYPHTYYWLQHHSCDCTAGITVQAFLRPASIFAPDTVNKQRAAVTEDCRPECALFPFADCHPECALHCSPLQTAALSVH